MAEAGNEPTRLTALCEEIRTFIAEAVDPSMAAALLREAIHDASPTKSQPVDLVKWVPLELVTPNDYNPNTVAGIEMSLLRTSIEHDGYTQPVVTIHDPAKGKFVIVDGFHRYYVMKTTPEISARTGGRLPIVVIDKGPNDRMASTVRHNRARGRHTVDGMANLVFEMLHNGWPDHAVCNELGMSPDELARLKHVTGFSKLFENAEYQREWIPRSHGWRKAREADAGNTP